MSAKRKSSEPGRNPPKRGRKKKVQEDMDSDFSDDHLDGADNGSGPSNVEVLIPSEELPLVKLPEDLLATYDKDPGNLLVAGLVTWDLTGRKDTKNKPAKIRPNLYTFHRFLKDEKVKPFMVNHTNGDQLMNCFLTVPFGSQWLCIGT